MKDMDVLFHLQYGRFMCSNRLQSETPKCQELLVEAGATKAMLK